MKPIQITGLAIGLCIELGTIATLAMPTEATALPASVSPHSQLDRPDLLLARYRRYARPYRLPRRGAPRWATGGAARGGCRSQEPPLVPLLPVDSQVAKEATFFGVTLAEHPTFFAYVPQTTARAVEFLLIEENDTGKSTVIDEATLPISGNPQVIRFKLDPQRPPLQVGKNYRWSFATVCDRKNLARDASGNPYIEGLIQRVAPEPMVSQQLEQASAHDRANLYAEHGYWLDAIEAMANLRCARPNDAALASDWTQLLQSMELDKIPALAKLVSRDNISQAPLSQCSAFIHSRTGGVGREMS